MALQSQKSVKTQNDILCKLQLQLNSPKAKLQQSL